MNVEAEILDLKLRVESLEAALRSNGGPDSRPRPNDIVPAQAGSYRSELPALVAQVSIGVSQLRAEIADVRTEVGQDFEALIVEIAGVRVQLSENHQAVQADLLGKIDSLRCDMIDLGLRLDRLTEKGGA
ncbi:hypothetical protein AB0J35_39935 [Nonomuraea angiospora]|uniref:hypothetical protein n=1 Tax=Nonomuraea angiospora TaxID=46172 RepID=UPI003425874F